MDAWAQAGSKLGDARPQVHYYMVIWSHGHMFIFLCYHVLVLVYSMTSGCW